jgi:hypothetical protein
MEISGLHGAGENRDARELAPCDQARVDGAPFFSAAMALSPIGMRSNDATPLSSQATTSPSMMQERERSRAKDFAISQRPLA